MTKENPFDREDLDGTLNYLYGYDHRMARELIQDWVDRKNLEITTGLSKEKEWEKSQGSSPSNVIKVSSPERLSLLKSLISDLVVVHALEEILAGKGNPLTAPNKRPPKNDAEVAHIYALAKNFSINAASKHLYVGRSAVEKCVKGIDGGFTEKEIARGYSERDLYVKEMARQNVDFCHAYCKDWDKTHGPIKRGCIPDVPHLYSDGGELNPEIDNYYDAQPVLAMVLKAKNLLLRIGFDSK
jgi:hypothetical protein